MRTQDQLVSDQFGSVAQAYLDSAVHARGQDLQALAERVRMRPDAMVLDLGCGAGHASFAAAPHAQKVIAYDLSDAMLNVVRTAAQERGFGNISTQLGSTDVLPFADGSFDMVCTRYSAHHWNHLDRALTEIARVLKPDGFFLLIDVIAPPTRVADTYLQAVEVLRDASHVRNQSLREWTAQLEQAGLHPGATRAWKLPLQFDEWVKRMRTPPERIVAIQSLWNVAPEEVKAYFRVQQDYSFSIDVAWIEAAKAV